MLTETDSCVGVSCDIWNKRDSMENKHKYAYVAPATVVVTVRAEQFLCTSNQSQSFFLGLMPPQTQDGINDYTSGGTHEW